MELQKNKALLLLKGFSVGMKLKLHSFAITIIVLSRSGLCSAQSITTFSHIFGCGLPSILQMESMGLDPWFGFVVLLRFGCLRIGRVGLG